MSVSIDYTKKKLFTNDVLCVHTGCTTSAFAQQIITPHYLFKEYGVCKNFLGPHRLVGGDNPQTNYWDLNCRFFGLARNPKYSNRITEMGLIGVHSEHLGLPSTGFHLV